MMHVSGILAGSITARLSAPPAGPVPHRYWSFVMEYPQAVENGYIGVSQIELRETAGGPNRATGATISTDKPIQAGSLATTIDGTPGLLQYNESNTPIRIAFDFGAGNAFDIARVKLWPNSDAANRSPANCFPYWSDDGVSWTYAGWFFGAWDWVAATGKEFIRPDGISNNVRFWRFHDLLTNPANELVGFVEAELRTTIGGADETGSGGAEAYSAYSGEDASKAVDNNTSTGFTASSTSPRMYWQYDFGAGTTKAIRELALTARSGFASRTPVTFSVAKSTDGYAWAHHATAVNFADNTWSDLQTQAASF